MTAYQDTPETTVIRSVQRDTMANCAQKFVLTVPTTPRVTTGTATVNVYQAGQQPTAPYPAVQDVLARSVLRPAPAHPASSVTDLLETACVRVEETSVNKTRPSRLGALWFHFLQVRGSPGEPSGASSCSSSWWCCCSLCCCCTAAGRRTNRTTRRPSPSPPAARSTLNTLFQMFLTATTTTTPTPATTH